MKVIIWDFFNSEAPQGVWFFYQPNMYDAICHILCHEMFSFFNPSCAETGILWDLLVNTMTDDDDDLASKRSKASMATQLS